MLRDQAENEFAFATRVTGINNSGDILALDQLVQQFQSRLGSRDGVQRKVRRDHGQMVETPFAALDFIFFRRVDFNEVADSRRQDVLVRLKVIIAGETTQRLAMSFAIDGFSAMIRVLAMVCVGK